jgi:hypothetical protein
MVLGESLHVSRMSLHGSSLNLYISVVSLHVYRGALMAPKEPPRLPGEPPCLLVSLQGSRVSHQVETPCLHKKPLMSIG